MALAVRPRFTEAELEIIRAAWADDSIASPVVVVAQQLPGRSPASIQVTASNRGWSRERKERRQARAEVIMAQHRAEREAKRAAAAKEKLVESATRAANVAAAALAEADRLAKEAGIAPLIVAGRPQPVEAKRVEAPRITSPLFIGACDFGDREIIRRRMVHTINALAGELRRAPSDVAAAVTAIAGAGWKREHLMGGYTLSDLEPTPGRTLKGVAL